MTVKLKVAWLLVFIALSAIVVPVIIYDVTKPSSLCNSGVTFPILGCIGSFFFGQVTLEHEGIGLGLVLAGSILYIPRGHATNMPIIVMLFGLGAILFFSDFPGDWFTNPTGSQVSIALGFTYGLIVSEMFHPESFGSVEVG